MATIKTLVTYLEMLKKPRQMPLQLPQNLRLKRVDNIEINEYIQLYKQIGSAYYWTSRLLISKAELAQIIHHPRVQIYVLFESGVAIGFFELNTKNAPKSVEISFVGLVPTAIGKGYGKLLTQCAVDYAWAQHSDSHHAGRVIIQTCTLDHKRALPLYQRLGFNAYDRHVAEFKTLDD